MDKSSQLTISGWFSRGWSTYKTNLRVLIGASVVLGLLGAISSWCLGGIFFTTM